ncbi:MAG: DUF3576 domain-containing protein [Pikeienuella sp.]
MKISVVVGVLVTVGLGLAGCGGTASKPRVDPQDSTTAGLPAETEQRLSDIAGFDLLGNGNGGGGLGTVNQHLWRASLDTLAFLPLNTTDPITGVIATDWASTPDAPEERFKVTAYVLGNALSPNTLKIAVFREIRDPAGAWTTAAVSGATARQLEDAILVKARQLRIGERESNE